MVNFLLASYWHAASAAIADISVNTTSGEICFHSVEDCSLTNFTQYNVTVTDFNGIVIFSEEYIPKDSCVIISELLSPDHAPLFISASLSMTTLNTGLSAEWSSQVGSHISCFCYAAVVVCHTSPHLSHTSTGNHDCSNDFYDILHSTITMIACMSRSDSIVVH